MSRCSAIEYIKGADAMRKFLISAVLAVSTLGLAACSDNVDEGATGSVEGGAGTTTTTEPVAPADPMAAPEEPAAPAQ
jgi:hypothetical protein